MNNITRKKAEKIKEMSLDSLTAVDVNRYITNEVSQQARLILDLLSEIQTLKNKIIEFAKTIDIFSIIQSIYGIGEYSTALFLAEEEDPIRFDNFKKLTVSCGLDPTIVQSGKSVNYHGPISKRGNKMSRKVLFNIVTNIIKSTSRGTKHLYNPILIYYRKNAVKENITTLV